MITPKTSRAATSSVFEQSRRVFQSCVRNNLSNTQRRSCNSHTGDCNSRCICTTQLNSYGNTSRVNYIFGERNRRLREATGHDPGNPGRYKGDVAVSFHYQSQIANCDDNLIIDVLTTFQSNLLELGHFSAEEGKPKPSKTCQKDCRRILSLSSISSEW